NQRQVLRAVVGGRADVLAAPPQAHALGVLDHEPEPGRPRIASGGTVGEQANGPHATTRIRPQLSHWSSPARRRTCMTFEVTATGQAWHWFPTTSATGFGIRSPTRR